MTWEANQEPDFRAIKTVNYTIYDMISEPGQPRPPVAEKRRIMAYGKRRGWRWNAAAKRFFIPEPR